MNYIKKLLLILLVPVMLSGVAVCASAEDMVSFSKARYPVDAVSEGTTPNVLIFLDIGSPMTFSPKGVIPISDGVKSPEDLNKMLEDCTYGSGARPLSRGGVEGRDLDVNGGSNRFGRDVDPDNNIIGHPDCYYSPFPDKPYFLTFKDKKFADWDGKGNPPSGFPDGLKKYLPGGSSFGRPIEKDEKDAIGKKLIEYLVPNDSRLYKMKLVLWRITSEKELFSSTNIAVSTTYSETYSEKNTNPSHLADFYRAAKENAKKGESAYYGANSTFTNGGAPEWSIGNIISGSLENYEMSQRTYSGIDRGYYEKGKGTREWAQVNRALMIAPFSKFYGIGGGATEHLNDFRKYIDGIEDIGADKNPELFADGKSPLAMAMHGRDDHLDKYDTAGGNSENISGGNHPLIAYSPGPKGSVFDYEIKYVPQGLIRLASKKKNSDGLYSGQAVGSIIDFFSPYVKETREGNYSNYKDYRNGLSFITSYSQSVGSSWPPKLNPNPYFFETTTGFFPVTGSCQQNWVIIFSAANDSDPDYTAADAAFKLFNDTRVMNGRKLASKKFHTGSDYMGNTYETLDYWQHRKYIMNSGVRTLVVGFVDEKATDTNSVQLIETLKKMAQNGDPIPAGTYEKVTLDLGDGKKEYTVPKYEPNPNAEPYFANDVPGLIKALEKIMERINVENMASGTPVNLPDIENETDDGIRRVFGASMKINNSNQWNSWLTKYSIEKNGTRHIEWEANEKLIAAAKDNKRNVYIFDKFAGGIGGSAVKINSLSDEGGGGFGALVGLRYPNGTTGGNTGLYGMVDVEHIKNFKNWLLAYDDKIGVLGEFSNSGIMVVDKPKAEELKNDPMVQKRPLSVYVQTNRGVLHALDYKTGEERWGFIPPNVAQGRLKDSSFWLDKSYLTPAVSLISNGSVPMTLLDGMLSARDVKIDGIYKTYMAGHLGGGGNGIYVMDVTSAGNVPIFKWAIENGKYLNESGGITDNGVKGWGEAYSAGDNNKTHDAAYDYSDLGLTIVPGVFISTSAGDVGVLPGGLGHSLGLGNNQGKALYIFAPKDGKIIKKFTSNAMFVSPVIYRDNSDKQTEEVYTSDSDGNIIRIDTVPSDISLWSPKNIFSLLTVDDETPDFKEKPVVIPHVMTLSSAFGERWLFGGTADIYAPRLTESSSNRGLLNDQNFIFGFNATKAEKALPTVIKTSNLKELDYADGDGIIPGYSRTSSGRGNLNYGWHLRLRPAVKTTNFGEISTKAEYVSAAPFLLRGVLYVGTFIPREESGDGATCNEAGIAKLYMLDASNGDIKKLSTFDNIKISGISGMGERVTIAFQELKGGALVDAAKKMPDAVSLGGGLFDLKGLGEPVAVDPPFEKIKPHIQYWREKFR